VGLRGGHHHLGDTNKPGLGEVDIEICAFIETSSPCSGLHVFKRP
jgi:hypothetical protein